MQNRRLVLVVIATWLALGLVFGGVEAALAAPGDLDTTFGGSGKVLVPFGDGSVETGNGVAVQSDGKVIIAGASTFLSDYSLKAVRFNSDGKLDSRGRTDANNAVGISSSAALFATGGARAGKTARSLRADLTRTIIRRVSVIIRQWSPVRISSCLRRWAVAAL